MNGYCTICGDYSHSAPCCPKGPAVIELDLGITYASEADETYTKDPQLKNQIEVTVTKHITDIHMYYTNEQQWHVCAYVLEWGQKIQDKVIIGECDGNSPEQALSKLLKYMRI